MDGRAPWIESRVIHMGKVCVILTIFDMKLTTTCRSVHNTSIERLWYDVTHGFGQKWKNFFMDLEANYSLNPRIPAHIWLVHHLFLSAINDDAAEWASTWNHHTMQLRRERNATPHELFFCSMVQDGLRGVSGLNPVDEEIAEEDLAGYGIDWEVASNPTYMRHLLDHNPEAGAVANPFEIGPSTLSDVPCEPPNCPFTPAQVQSLDAHLLDTGHLDSRNMQIRCLIWQTALTFCSNVFALQA